MLTRPLLALALVPAACAPALAALPPSEQASRGPLPARSPEVAVNARGDAAAVWVRGAGRDAAIVVSRRPSGEAWGDPTAISRRGRPAIDPDIAVDAQGRVVVLWRQVLGTRIVQTRRGPRRQAVYVARARERGPEDPRWSAITTLSSRRQKVGPPELAVAGDGTAVATWHWGTGTSPGDPGFVGVVQFVERRSDASWTGPARLSRSPLCAQVRLPQTAMSGEGHAVVWWQCDLPGDRRTALAVSRPPGGTFGSELELPFEAEREVRADLAIAPDGRAVAVSADGDGALSWWRGQVTTSLAVSALPVLGAADRISPDAGPPVVAVSAAGDALSAWISSDGRPRAAPIAAGLGVGAPSTLGPAGDGVSSIRVAVGDERRGAAAWIADGRVQLSSRAADGTMAEGEAASRSGVREADPPALAVDGSGATSLLWARVAGNRPIVERLGAVP